MLERAEKADWMALDALRRKEYRAAAAHFEVAAPRFRHDKEFVLFLETTRLLVSLQDTLKGGRSVDDDLEIEEVFSDVQETDIRR